LITVQAILATPKSQNALKIGCFGNKNQSKMDKKCVLPKIVLDYVGCTNKWNEPILSPCGAILAPLKAERALKMGQFGTRADEKFWHCGHRMMLLNLFQQPLKSSWATHNMQDIQITAHLVS
jgi:hypothetical protein